MTTKDKMPDYVQLPVQDANVVATNDAAVLNFTMQKISTWIVNGGVDAEWDAYVSEVKRIGVDQNVEFWQKAYDTYVK